MNREQLDTAPIEALQKEAIACGIPFTPVRADLTDAILSHRERHSSTAPGGGMNREAGVEGDIDATEQLRQTVELLAKTIRQQQCDMLHQ